MSRLYIVLIVTLLVSCNKYDKGSDNFEGEKVEIKLNFSAVEDTKGSTLSEEFYDLNLFIYSSKGILQNHVYSSQVGALSIAVRKGVKRVVAIINNGNMDSNNYKDIESLRGAKVRADAMSGGKMLFSGESTINASNHNQSFTIDVKRLFAKITFLFDKSALNSDINLEIIKVALKNIADGTPVLSSGITSEHTIIEEGPYLQGEALEATSHNSAIPLYITENLQGNIGNNSIAKNKHPGSKEGLCTYAEITAEYSSPVQSGTIKYRFFLGSNNTNNYDIERGKHYKQKIYFNGTSVDEISWRVDLSHLDMVLYSVTAIADPLMGGVITGIGHYKYQELPMLEAHPSLGYQFAGWIPPLGPVTADIEYKALFFLKFIKITGVEVIPNKAQLNVSETLQLEAEISPPDAINKEVEWSSMNGDIAKVGNKTGLVETLKRGIARIRVLTVEGFYTNHCDIDVYDSLHIYVAKTEMITQHSETEMVESATIMLYCRADMNRPSNMAIINEIYDKVSVNVIYSYTVNGETYHDSTILKLDRVENNDKEWQLNNAKIALTVSNLSLQEYNQIYNSFQIEAEPKTVLKNHLYIHW